jgi:hypothetical protein
MVLITQPKERKIDRGEQMCDAHKRHELEKKIPSQTVLEALELVNHFLNYGITGSIFDTILNILVTSMTLHQCEEEDPQGVSLFT